MTGSTTLRGTDAATETHFELVAQAPPVPAAELESPTELAVAVTVSWGSYVLETRHFSPPRRVTLGVAHGVDFVVPDGLLDLEEVPLVEVEDDDVVLAARRWCELAWVTSAPAFAQRNEAPPPPSYGDSDRHILREGDGAGVVLGGLTLSVALVPAGKPTPRGVLTVSRAARCHFLAIASAFGVLMVVLAQLAPLLHQLPSESDRNEQLYLIQQYLEVERVGDDEMTVPAPDGDDPTEVVGGPGSRAPDENGPTGNENAGPRHATWAIAGPPDNSNPYLAKRRALAEARSFGLIGLLGTGARSGPTLAFARDEALGRDSLTADGNMWNEHIDDSFEMNGLALIGIGQGGGGQADGLIGVGDDGFGHGAGGCGMCAGEGQGSGRIGGSHRTNVPQVRSSNALVAGRLPASSIQRVVRQGFGRVRSCYARALERNPRAEGRVTVRFVIDREGAVSNSVSAPSEFPDAAAASCIARAFYGLSFPKPEAGVVTVVYPIELRPT